MAPDIQPASLINIFPTGGTGTGLKVTLLTNSGGQVASVLAIDSEGAGYSHGDVLGVPGGNDDATLTVALDRTGQVADVTITNGAVTALAITISEQTPQQET